MLFRSTVKTLQIYPVGVVSASKHKDAAEKFVEFLQSEEALKVFESYGFQKNAE